MKTLIAAAIVIFALAACNTTPTPANPELPASASTTTKTGITGWKLSGSSNSASMNGLAGTAVRREIKLTQNPDGSTNAVDRILDATGAEVFKATFTLKNGEITSSSPNTNAPTNLCPECVAQDVASTFPNLRGILENPSSASARRALSPAFTGFTFVIDFTCAQARAALDAILAQQAKVCARNPNGQNCQDLQGAAIYGAQIVIAECGIALF